MEPSKPALAEAPPLSNEVARTIQAAVERALAPTHAFRREAEARLARLELEIAALRASTRASGG